MGVRPEGKGQEWDAGREKTEGKDERKRRRKRGEGERKVKGKV